MSRPKLRQGKQERIHMEFPADLKKELQAYATQHGITFTSLMKEAAEDFLKKNNHLEIIEKKVV